MAAAPGKTVADVALPAILTEQVGTCGDVYIVELVLVLLPDGAARGAAGG